MTGEQIGLWLGIVAVAITIIIAAARLVRWGVRGVRGRLVRHRHKVMRAAVQPLFDQNTDHVDSELTAIRHSQGELSDAIGATTRRVADLEFAITNGITEDVADIKKEQTRAGKRIDKIYDHLID